MLLVGGGVGFALLNGGVLICCCRVLLVFVVVWPCAGSNYFGVSSQLCFGDVLVALFCLVSPERMAEPSAETLGINPWHVFKRAPRASEMPQAYFFVWIKTGDGSGCDKRI